MTITTVVFMTAAEADTKEGREAKWRSEIMVVDGKMVKNRDGFPYPEHDAEHKALRAFVRRMARTPKDQELVDVLGLPTGHDAFEYEELPDGWSLNDRDNDETNELLNQWINEARDFGLETSPEVQPVAGSHGAWVFERSSGFAGYRCVNCGTWRYENQDKKCRCDG